MSWEARALRPSTFELTSSHGSLELWHKLRLHNGITNTSIPQRESTDHIQQLSKGWPPCTCERKSLLGWLWKQWPIGISCARQSRKWNNHRIHKQCVVYCHLDKWTIPHQQKLKAAPQRPRNRLVAPIRSVTVPRDCGLKWACRYWIEVLRLLGTCDCVTVNMLS